MQSDNLTVCQFDSLTVVFPDMDSLAGSTLVRADGSQAAADAVLEGKVGTQLQMWLC